MQRFIFQHPEYLLALAVVLPALLFIITLHWLQKRKRVRKLADRSLKEKMLPGFTFARFALKKTLLLLAITGIFFALARPRFGKIAVETERSGIYLCIALDLSSSMLAEDLMPNRLTRARMAIQQLFNRLKNDQLAMVYFAGNAKLAVPMTPDLAFAQMSLEYADTEWPEVQGTNLTEALDIAMGAFPENRTGGAAIILISDGENHEGEAIQKAKEAYNSNIVVHTLGIGKNQSVPIPVYQGNNLTGYKKDAEGQTVMTRLNENLLKEIARAGGGIYMPGENPTQALNQIFTHIESMNTEVFELDEREEHKEQYLWFLWPAFCFLLAESLISERSIPWWKRIGLF